MGWIAGPYGAREVEETAGWTGIWLHHAGSLARIRRKGQDVHATKEGAESAMGKRAAEPRQCPDVALAPLICPRCIDCEGEAHHWMVECDEKRPEGVMTCRHCPATRPITDEDLDNLD